MEVDAKGLPLFLDHDLPERITLPSQEPAMQKLLFSGWRRCSPRSLTSVSWGDQMSAEEGAAAAGSDEWQEARSKSSKRRRDPSGDQHQQQRLRKETRSPQPFPLRLYKERVAQVLKVYDAAGEIGQRDVGG